MNYQTLLNEADNNNVFVQEKHIRGKFKGLFSDDTIVIESNMSEALKCCTLAEELGHYHTTVGDILNLKITNNRKQELRARNWAVEKLVELEKLKEFLQEENNLACDVAEYFNVTIDFLADSIDYYRIKNKI